jgi:hypothetical protein
MLAHFSVQLWASSVNSVLVLTIRASTSDGLFAELALPLLRNSLLGLLSDGTVKSANRAQVSTLTFEQ